MSPFQSLWWVWTSSSLTTGITQVWLDIVPAGRRGWRNCPQTGLWTGSGTWLLFHTSSWHDYIHSFSVVRKHQVNVFNLNNSLQCEKERWASKIANSKRFKVLLVTDQTLPVLSSTRICWPFTYLWRELGLQGEKWLLKYYLVPRHSLHSKIFKSV